jgi:flavin-dependent dehydrogenase
MVRLSCAARRAARPGLPGARVYTFAPMDSTAQPSDGMPAEPRRDGAPDRYDVVVVGGSIAGGAAALLLRRQIPGCRVLVVERQEKFGRKVGEATVETSGWFLTRVLGLYDHLVRTHLPKHGLRYWFSDRPGRTLDEISEVGPMKVSALPSFQLDRAKLDEHVLATAHAEGADLDRPAKVTAVELGWPESRLTVESAAGQREVRARWVVDASGRQTFIARRLGLVEKVERHPTGAVWARFKGVADLDGPAIQGADAANPRLRPVLAARRLATNHFCGYGWWCWVIPLGNGDTSVGIVYDRRLFKWASEGRLKERFEHFVRTQISGLDELLAPAKMDEDDFLAYASLPYRSRQYMAKGWALVGDAGAFMDPYYSPGLDHAAMSIWATVTMIRRDLAGELAGEALDAAVANHNGDFYRSYDGWLDALYTDKYELMGDAELLTSAFLFDTGMYYLGVVINIQKDFSLLGSPAFGPDEPSTRLALAFMRGFKARLVKLARFRRAVGTYGKRNLGWRHYPTRFDVTRERSIGLVKEGLALWWGVEKEYLKHRLLFRGRVDLSPPRAAVDEPQMVADARAVTGEAAVVAQ